MTKVDKLNFKFNLDLGSVSDSEDDDTKTEKTTARSEKTIECEEPSAPPPKAKKDGEKSKLSMKSLKDASKFVTIGGKGIGTSGWYGSGVSLYCISC